MSNTTIDWDALREEYGRGGSDIEIARMMGVTASKFYELYEKHAAFAEFVEAGRTLAQAWWYEQARKGLWNRSFNTSLFNFVMKNRYGWADKVESADTTDKLGVNVDELKAQLSAAMSKLATTNPELFSGVRLNSNAEAKGRE